MVKGKAQDGANNKNKGCKVKNNRQMKKAFLISAYTDPFQLCNQINTLEDEKHWFFIHIDKNVDITPFYDAISRKRNVMFVTNRYSVSWGGIRKFVIKWRCCGAALKAA